MPETLELPPPSTTAPEPSKGKPAKPSPCSDAELLLPPVHVSVQIQDARKVPPHERAIRPGLRPLEMEIFGAGDEPPEALARQLDATKARVWQELEAAQAKAWESPAVAKVRHLTEGLDTASRQLSQVRAGASAAKRKVQDALRSGAVPDEAEKQFLDLQDEERRLALRVKELPALIAEAKSEAIQAVKEAVTARAAELLAEFRDEKERHEEIFVRHLREHVPRIAIADVGIFMLDFRAAAIRHGVQQDLREILARLPGDLSH